MPLIPRYRTRPRHVAARQWTGDYAAMSDFCPGCIRYGKNLVVPTKHGSFIANPNDYVVALTEKDFAVYAPSVFAELYKEDG